MVDAGGYCVDRYEWPNREGERPLVGASAVPEEQDVAAGVTLDAETLCAEQGKRLCTRTEWVKACEYSATPAPPKDSCNTDKRWMEPSQGKVAARDEREMKRLDQSEPSGSSDCVSDSGAEDMVGNAEEWVRCDGGLDGYCLMGRFWADRQHCTYTVSNHSGRWHYYDTGFRCCADL